MAHAKYSPSAASRWMRCPGSIVLTADAPEDKSAYADEGTCAHALAALVLGENDIAAGKRVTCDAYIGRVFDDAPTVSVDEEMAEFVQVYVDQILDTRAKLARDSDGCTLLVEQQVDFSHIVNVPEQFGTSDVVMFTEKVLSIHDLKYGKGVQVLAEGNEQLLTYAMAAYDQFSTLGDFEEIVLNIHQPRLDHLDTWRISVEQLMDFKHELLVAVEDCQKAESLASKGADIAAYLTPGDKQCQWCKAKATCPALARKVYETVAQDFDEITDVDALTAKHSAKLRLTATETAPMARLGSAMDAVGLIEDWCRAVRGAVERELVLGNNVPGYKLVEGRKGSRAWRDEQEAEGLMKASRLKVDEMYDFKVISPTKAEKLLAKEKPRVWRKFLELIRQTEGKPSVAPLTDKRPAITVGAAADDFNDLGEGGTASPQPADDYADLL